MVGASPRRFCMKALGRRCVNGIPDASSSFSPSACHRATRTVTNSYAYDPRLLQIEDTFYITWCDDFPGPSIGLGRSQDLRTFIKMEHPLMPFNRNGVLFPRKIDGLYALLSRPSYSGHTPFGDIILSYSPDLTYRSEEHTSELQS